MHRDVERAEPLLLQSSPVGLFQIGQGDEVAEEEAITVVVVFDIEGLAHAKWQTALGLVALWQSFDEAEDTLVGADADEGRWLLAEADAHFVVWRLGDQHHARASVAVDAQRYLFVGGVKLVVHQVAYWIVID